MLQLRTGFLLQTAAFESHGLLLEARALLLQLWSCQCKKIAEPWAGNTLHGHTVLPWRSGLGDKCTIYVYLKRKQQKRHQLICHLFPHIWPYLLLIQMYGGVPELCWFLVCLFLVSIYWWLFSAHWSMQSRAKMLYAVGSRISGKAKLQLLRERNYWNGRSFQFKSCCVCFCDLFA